MRDLKHIGEVLPGVLEEARQNQERFEYEHARPRALDAVSRAREAQHQVRAPQAPVRIVKRNRLPAGSVSRGTVCPHCDCAATKVAREVHCQWCGYVTLADGVTWTIVGACMLHDGSWPAHDGAAP